jgi:hypothetical protein
MRPHTSTTGREAVQVMTPAMLHELCGVVDASD